jgi:hypothetical protein
MSSYAAHPLRVRRSRKKGSRLPAGAVVVSRPSKWGNPFSVAKQAGGGWARIASYGSMGQFAAPGPAAALYRWWLQHTAEGQELLAKLPELRGKQLACWCPLDQPCHADVLAELANA